MPGDIATTMTEANVPDTNKRRAALKASRKKRYSKKPPPSETTSLSSEKAKKILRHGKVRGKPLTEKARGFLGAVAGKGGD